MVKYVLSVARTVFETAEQLDELRIETVDPDLVILSILFEMPILRRFLDIKAALWYNVRCMIIYFCTFRTALSPWKMRYTGLSAMR